MFLREQAAAKTKGKQKEHNSFQEDIYFDKSNANKVNLMHNEDKRVKSDRTTLFETDFCREKSEAGLIRYVIKKQLITSSKN